MIRDERAGAVGARLLGAAREWDARDGTRRLAGRDATLWTGADEGRWLDWLDLGPARAAAESGLRLAAEARSEGLSRVLLAGMGGSSLCPEVLSRVFPDAGGLALTVLDTVDPAAVRRLLDGVDWKRALVVVASKSGSTLEPNLLKALLHARLRETLGERDALRRLVAITDPGSSLHEEATRGKWRAVVAGVPGIGGRYSALSPFGIVPAALLGLDVAALLERASAMRQRCLSEPATTNPGVSLGLALGTLALEGRDKLTLLASPALQPVGAWIEQLVAESTGKWGRGILPVDLEPAADPRKAGDDRVFVALRLGSEPGAGFDARLRALLDAGHPVLRCDLPERIDLGAAFFEWEIATAVAGARLGIHPFDQPDVEASKVAARARMEGRGSEAAAPRVVLAKGGGVTIEADERTARELRARLDDEPSIADVIAAHAGRLRAPASLALLCWRCDDERVMSALHELRRRLGRGGALATTLGVGPRFLHSTGQLHKGGPPGGSYMEIVGPAAPDLEVPGGAATFGSVLMAQAEGDFDVLASRGRRAILIRLDSAEAAASLLQAVAG